ncbi:M50 family metallopeptidase [Methylocystis bryophila]|uniref:RIP metalloprotease RseP n=1 Tax=Methylocystis bryophila TaxID=655015 RepID=A0A1W6MZT5_9HYPH|nr:RIP metalloprotease [Methylocystis bryophila]ARN83059.1 RIP metalloprotease RseP [Methylocystis bryophila]BDV39368.1 zinc metalloprotease [Methylocystis bryophila]
MDYIWTTASYIVPFVVVLGVVVFVHEYGHFIVGRLCGVKVDAFSLGFGPELFAFEDRHATRWRISAIPLGGYVKFHGDANAVTAGVSDEFQQMSSEERAVTFAGQPVWKRAAVVFAGPFFNFLLAIALYWGMFALVGRPVVVDGQLVIAPRISAVQADGAGAKAGFRPGDLVKSVDGAPIESFALFQKRIAASPGRALHIVVERGSASAELEATPAAVSGKDGQTIGRLGLNSSEDIRDMRMRKCGPIESLGLAFEETGSIVEQTGKFIEGIFAGRESASQLSGPIGIAEASGKMAQKISSLGIWPLINLIALLSVSVGLLNLMPVPLLDGGHLMFFVIEAVRGRALNERLQEYAFKIGFVMVSSLMLLATYNDLARHLKL